MEEISRRFTLLLKDVKLLLHKKNTIKKKIKGKGNQIVVKKASIRAEITINGNHNHIFIQPFAKLHKVKIHINGNFNSVCISEKVQFNQGGLIWIEDNHCILRIGRGTTIEEASFAITEDHSKIEIGEDCMFAYDIEVKTGDSHSIIDLETNKRINFAKSVIIGNHVWVGAHAILLKGTVIPDCCIVASNAVVTKSFEKPNAILAGNPAHTLKEGVTWDRKRREV